MAQSSPSLGLFIFLTVVVLVAAGVGGVLLYEANHPKAPSHPLTVAVGDNVTVNYIGQFGSGPEIGKVFDTSLKAVADDNATYPKSLEYSPRNGSGYAPLPVHVGPKTPRGGYSLNGTTYGSVVTGFWKGLLGLAVGQSRSAAVPPEEGYGPLNQSCLKTGQLLQSLPSVVTYTPTAFTKAYPGVTAASGVTFPDPTYGWTDRVQSSNGTAVVLARAPAVGQTVHPFGWPILVTAVTSSTISLQNQLTPASVGSVLGKISNTTVCSTTSFLVWAVDLSSGTFTMNYNREVTGETLLFTVTIVTILPP